MSDKALVLLCSNLQQPWIPSQGEWKPTPCFVLIGSVTITFPAATVNGKLHTDLATTATGDKTVNDDGFA